MKSKKNKAITNDKKPIKSEQLRQELLSLHEFRFLPSRIDFLQSNTSTLSEQLKVLDDVKSKLSGYSLEKLDKSLMKNPDLEKFTSKTNSLQFRVKISHSPQPSLHVRLKDLFHFIKIF